MKKVTILISVFFWVAVSVFGANLSEILEKGVLVMGTEATFPPFEFVNEKNEITGFDVEIGKALAEKLGVKLEVKDMAFDGLLPALNVGKFDIIIAGMTITDDRKKVVSFSDKYFEAGQAVVVNGNDKKYNSLQELSGKKVAVQAGTTGDLMISEVEGTDVIRFSKYTEAFLELSLKRVEAVVIDYSTAESYLKTNKKLSVASPILSEESYGIAIKKDNTDLLKAVNEFLKEFKDNGYDELNKKWFE